MKRPLISQIVDREERLRGRKERVVTVDRLQVSRDESRLPVVAMNDVRRVAQPFRQFDHGAAEESEALGVKITGTVDVTAPEIFRVINEVNRRAVEIIQPH